MLIKTMKENLYESTPNGNTGAFLKTEMKFFFTCNLSKMKDWLLIPPQTQDKSFFVVG